MKEEFKIWFIFGRHLDGRVDVSDLEGDIVTNITQKEAERIINERTKLINAYENNLMKEEKEILDELVPRWRKNNENDPVW